jgi:hypothetical protein
MLADAVAAHFPRRERRFADGRRLVRHRRIVDGALVTG